MKRFSYAVCLSAMLCCGVLTSCRTGSVASVDDPCFSRPPDVLQDDTRITVRLYDSGRQFSGVERPSIEFRDGKIYLISSGYVESAGGMRPFHYDLPKDHMKQDLNGKIYWVNVNGEAVPIPVKFRNLP